MTAQDKKDPPPKTEKDDPLFPELVTVKSFDKDGKEVFSKEGVRARWVNEKWQIRAKDVPTGMKPGEHVIDKDKTVWVVEKVTKSGGGNPAYICEVTKKP